MDRHTKRWLAIALTVAILGLLATTAMAGEFTPPKGAIPLGARPLGLCPGYFADYDMDEDPTNGAEFTLVVDGKSGKPHAALVYEPGMDGRLVKATIRRPGGVLVEVFTSVEDLSMAYPSPCDILKPVAGA